MSSREGFLQAAGYLADDPLTDLHVVERVDALRVWFAYNLDLPARFNRSSSKGYYRREAKGLSWFKPTATEHIAKSFELKAILDEHGYPIHVLKEVKIGYVVYEDSYQVVAEPYNDTVT